MMELILVDPNGALCSEWKKAFADYPEVYIQQGYFEQVSAFDCMVSAANSFGLMDGGVDLAIIKFFGKDLENRVQQHILDHYLGEQPVGTSFIIPTHHPQHPFVAHTPTMRVPRSIAGTDHVYLAMKAMLVADLRHNQDISPVKIKRIACPGLGTSTGRVPAKEAARQMALAYRYVKFPPKTLNWRFATIRQNEIRHGVNLK